MPEKRAAQRAKTYDAHRGRQRRRIVDAARRLFDGRGIDRVRMAEITVASGLRASTVYQYFANKDDIVWAILNDAFEESSERAIDSIEGAETAHAKIAGIFEYMADELAKNPAKVRFLAQFDALYAHDWPAKRLLDLESRVHFQGFRYLKALIGEGIADGSLRRDLDPDLTMQAVLNAVVGTQRRLASLGKKVELEYGQPVDRLLRETIRIILLGLQAPRPQTVRRKSKPSRGNKRNTRRRVT